jgi:hypothetical protein
MSNITIIKKADPQSILEALNKSIDKKNHQSINIEDLTVAIYMLIKNKDNEENINKIFKDVSLHHIKHSQHVFTHFISVSLYTKENGNVFYTYNFIYN